MSKRTTPSTRRAVVMANAEGLPNLKIAKIFDTSERTVQNILKKWQTEGTVEKKPKKFDAIEQFIVEILKEDPFKSALVVRSEIFKKFNQSISYRTANTILKRHNSLKNSYGEDLVTN
ncbi:homeodomain-like domain-containing protein [Ditylenchus destructor]|nr:homeodomain-like domain-containing protein [Ditylenchus destructor]